MQQHALCVITRNSTLAFCQSGSSALLRMAARKCTRSSLALRRTPPAQPWPVCSARLVFFWQAAAWYLAEQPELLWRTGDNAVRHAQRCDKSAQQVQPVS